MCELAPGGDGRGARSRQLLDAAFSDDAQPSSSRDTVPVTPHRLDGADREQAWQRIAAAQPRIAKDQSKPDREYPVVRLALR
jgi:hypothetical protein